MASIADIVSAISTFSEAPSRMTIIDEVTGQPFRDAGTGDTGWIDVFPAKGREARKFDRQLFDDAKSRAGRALSSDELLNLDCRKAAVLTAGWHLTTPAGEPVDAPFSYDLAVQVYAAMTWLRDQVLAHSANMGNFPLAASPN